MTVAFFGHSAYTAGAGDEEKLLAILTEKIGDEPAELLFGGSGAFDSFALYCAKKYQQAHPNVKLVLVPPERIEVGHKDAKEHSVSVYDEVLYPKIKEKPARYAISYRNKWMVERSDLVIMYITHKSTVAHQAYRCAQRKKKPIFNIGKIEY